MKKAEKIEEMLRKLGGGDEAGELDPCYTGYFTCFNEQRYYEAHDVLEHLWLRNRDADHAFYKGLIQFAGAFVHLQKQHARPHHPKDANRARPAVRLLQLAARNLTAYRPRHLRLDVEGVWNYCHELASEIAHRGYANPWTPDKAPLLKLDE